MARAPDFDLVAALAKPNFTPAVKDAHAIVALLASDDEVTVGRAQAVLAGLGEPGRIAIERALDAGIVAEGAHAATIQALGLFARKGDDAALARLLAYLVPPAHPAARVRRAAISALGKLASPADHVRDVVIARWDSSEVPPDERRTLAEALGKLGGDAALDRLRALDPMGDAELERRRDRALLVADRGAKRGEDSEVRTDVAPPTPLAVVLHCKPGLAGLLVDELRALKIEAVAEGDHAAHITLATPWAALYGARLWATAGIRVPRPVGEGTALAASIIAGLTAPGTRALLAAWTNGPIRWRLELPEGKQRAVVWRVARDVTAAAPELVNDPTATTWDVRIADATALELIPRRAVDPRFAYRSADVPAASHPTVAAALAKVAEPRKGDRVWDPFVGSGLELIEVARLFAVRSLAGHDLDERALAAAKQNLDGAKLAATLVRGDARAAEGSEDCELIITNPPLGSRVQVDAAALLVEMLPVIARRLTRGGRLVWITPAPKQTSPVAEALQLRRGFWTPIDLGGVRGRLEIWTR